MITVSLGLMQKVKCHILKRGTRGKMMTNRNEERAQADPVAAYRSTRATPESLERRTWHSPAKPTAAKRKSRQRTYRRFKEESAHRIEAQLDSDYQIICRCQGQRAWTAVRFGHALGWD